MNGERVKKRRKELGLTQAELGELVGLKKAQISNIETGKRSTPSKNSQLFAKALQTSVAYLMGESDEPSVDPELLPVPGYPQSRPIPVISWVMAGKFAEAVDCWPEGVSGEDEPVFSRRHLSPRAFALRVVGESMETRYKEGDIIVVDPEIEVSTGDPCVAKVAGEVTFKIYYENGTEIRLKALNPKYPDMVFPKEGAVDFCVVGKVVELIAKI